MTCQDSFHEVAFNISFWTRNISSARILFWRGVHASGALSVHCGLLVSDEPRIRALRSPRSGTMLITRIRQERAHSVLKFFNDY